MIIYSALYRWVKNGSLQVMPAPVDKDTPNALWEAARARKMAPVLARYGCDAWLWPPLTMSQGGTASNADGYGRQYDLNVGQFQSRPTRWGTAEDVLSANEVLHANGMLVLEDAVIHQYDGGNRQYYVELGSNGKPDLTLFPKYPDCFVPNVKVDKVFDPEGNMSFGDMVSYQNSTPPGYMLNGVVRSMVWRKKRFALDGGRLDDTKGTAASVSQRIIERVGGWWFGECFTGNPAELESWVQQSGGKRTLDFPLHWALQAVCDDSASFRILQGAGLCSRDPDHSVVFVDTADTDQNDNENIKFNKLWGYVIALMYPSAATLIYAGDYERYGLAPFINNLMWISTTFAIGNLIYQYIDDTLIAFSRDGDGGQYGWSGGLLVAINSDPINHRSEWIRTTFPPNTHLHNYATTEWNLDVWTNEDGWAYVTVPPNVNGSGQSYVCYAPTGVAYTIPIPRVAHNPVGSFTDFSDF